MRKDGCDKRLIVNRLVTRSLITTKNDFMGILSNLKPEPVFRYFEEICQIPHGSGNTKEISDYCVRFAKEHGLRHIQDSANNIIIFKPGTTGYENSAPVILQGHLDMVCEKEFDCDIDMDREGLQLEVQGDMISARGTTLGGDDGIAVAYALAILDADDIPHPPLEAVFTVDEEIGMLGAAALDCTPLKSRIMLNLDSEDEGYLLVGCAGGISVKGSIPTTRFSASGKKATLRISGLLGGHSGIEIDKSRANACKLLGRTLYALQKEVSFLLCSLQGGLKDNAIPRDATATLLLDGDADESKIAECINKIQQKYQNEYRKSDPGVTCAITFSESGTANAMTPDISKNVIAALVNFPNGVQRMSLDIEGLVQTSLNLGIMKTSEEEFTCSFSLRSSVESEKHALVEQIECLMESLGGSLKTMGEYPAWEYRPDSPLRDLMVEVFEDQYGRKPVIQAIHAGVECGLFAGNLPGLDCVSFGPDMKGIHTPKEVLDAASVLRTWEYTLEVLKRLK